MAEHIRRRAREVGKELGQTFTLTKRFIKKRVSVPRSVGGQPPLAFALVQQPMSVQRPRPVRRKVKRRRR